MQEAAQMAGMTFIRTGADGARDFWVIEEAADWGESNRLGRAAAAELLQHIRATGNAHLLGVVVRSMIKKGRYGGVEVGFFARLVEAAF